jgi:hypothetical protein
MNSLEIMLAIATAVLPAVALPAAADNQPGGCTVKITGGLEQTFACTAELSNLNGWTLVVGGKSSLPYDFGGMLTFEGDPKVGKVYTLGDLDSAMQMVRDKHDKEGNSWSASASKKPSPWGDKKIPPPVGSLTLKLTAVGPAPAVHGTLTVTLKPDTFNKNTKDVVLSFEF